MDGEETKKLTERLQDVAARGLRPGCAVVAALVIAASSRADGFAE